MPPAITMLRVFCQTPWFWWVMLQVASPAALLRALQGDGVARGGLLHAARHAEVCPRPGTSVLTRSAPYSHDTRPDVIHPLSRLLIGP